MMYELPTTLEIDGVEHPIRSDYRAVLDICTALADNELTSQEKGLALLTILYEDVEAITNLEEAVKKGLWFVACGDDTTPQRKAPKLMDWEKDFSLIVAPVNRIAGCEIRSLPYMHWWTFIGYYYEIGDCAFANIVSIRSKKAKGKKLEKWEQEFYRENRDKIDLRAGVTEADKALIRGILGG